jgi:hypothetical protein
MLFNTKMCRVEHSGSKSQRWWFKSIQALHYSMGLSPNGKALGFKIKLGFKRIGCCVSKWFLYHMALGRGNRAVSSPPFLKGEQNAKSV